MATSVSKEFRLAAACCRWPPGAARDNAIAEAATGPIDWEAFLRIVRRQRVEGLVGPALRQSGVRVPEYVSRQLSTASAEIAQENLLHARESLRLWAAFTAAEIPILFIKGTTLSMLAYGTLSAKKARDIDIIVPAEAMGKSFQLLRAAGYKCLTNFGDTNPSAGTATGLAKETVWENNLGILVELHSELVDNPMLLPGVGIGSPTQAVEIAPGRTLPTLEKDQLFSYLCIHGATHAWSRLKWLADVAAFISRDDQLEVERLYRVSAAAGAGRSAGQALLLCNELLGTELPETLRRELTSDRGTRWLVRVAIRMMAGSFSQRELDETVLGTVPIHFSHFLMKRGHQFKLSELRRKAAGRPQAASKSLPAFMRVLMPLIAIPLWLRTRARERIGR